MKVTDIQDQKNNKQRVSVFVDNEYAFSLDREDLFFLKIKVGRELTKEDIDECVTACNFTKARNKAFDIISRKPLSSYELITKLKEKGYDTIVCEKVKEELTSLGYIDDASYANLFLEYCLSKMWVKRKIEFEMINKGLSKDIIDEVLNSIDNEEQDEKIKETILLKYKGENLSDIKVKAKITRYFASRGFDFSVIEKAIRQAIGEMEND